MFKSFGHLTLFRVCTLLESPWKLQSVLESPWISVLPLSKRDSRVAKLIKKEQTQIERPSGWNCSCCPRTKNKDSRFFFCTEWSPWKVGNVFLKSPWIFCSKTCTSPDYSSELLKWCYLVSFSLSYITTLIHKGNCVCTCILWTKVYSCGIQGSNKSPIK